MGSLDSRKKNQVYDTSKSKALFEQIKKYEAGGVGSNDRLKVDPYPIFFAEGKGSRFRDVDGNEYIDYNLGFGPLLLGHSPDKLIEAANRQLQCGADYGAPFELEMKVAQKICEIIPCFELMRFNTTGTEAVQSALRAARAFTGKNKIIKFEGEYHGWVDNVTVSYIANTVDLLGPRENPTKLIFSKGVSPSVLQDVIIVPFNDLGAVEEAVKREGDQIAALLTEPIVSNAGIIPPRPGFLEGLRKITAENNIVLIFDEVVTGFRIALGGAQQHFGVTPDLSVFAKAVGNGMPISGFGGRADIMEEIVSQRVMHAGTYNSNPVSIAVADAALDLLSQDNGAVYRHITRLACRLQSGLEEIYRRNGIVCCTNRVEPLFGFFFTEGPVHEYRDTLSQDAEKIQRVRREMRMRGVYSKPTPRDVWYVSAAHTDQDIDITLEIAEEAVKAAG